MKTQIKKDSKGQIGETLTWIVATLIIIVILIVFIFGASLLGKTKVVGNFRESLTSGKSIEEIDPFLRKSFFTLFSLNSIEQKDVLEKKMLSLYEKGVFEEDYNITRMEIVLNYNKR
ncbi:MAG: hypothetical protein NUV46_02130 [Nanoarchaeota archaeon]|nr:hypothetical protein [Nanoarchaeota archaeon]